MIQHEQEGPQVKGEKREREECVCVCVFLFLHVCICACMCVRHNEGETDRKQEETERFGERERPGERTRRWKKFSGKIAKRQAASAISTVTQRGHFYSDADTKLKLSSADLCGECHWQHW